MFNDFPEISAELAEAFRIFKPPFRYSKMGQRIVDSEGNMILDVRGWGRLSKLPNGERIQDAYGEYFAQLINRDLRLRSAENYSEMLKSDDGFVREFDNKWTDGESK